MQLDIQALALVQDQNHASEYFEHTVYSTTQTTTEPSINCRLRGDTLIGGNKLDVILIEFASEYKRGTEINYGAKL